MLLSRLFPCFQLDEATSEAWRLVFRDENPNDVARAIANMARSGQQDFVPTASDVFRELKKIKPSTSGKIAKVSSEFFEGEVRRRASIGQVCVVEDMPDSTAKAITWVHKSETRPLGGYWMVRGVEVEKRERF